MFHSAGHMNSLKAASMWGRLRKWKFSDLALEVLVDSVLNNHERLYGALSASTSLGQKTKIWKDISEKVNAVDVVQRSVPDLKKRWYDFKRKVKQTVAANQSQGLQSGTSKEACLTALQARVYAVMLSTTARSSDRPDKRHSQEPYTGIPVKIEVKSEEWDLGYTSSLDEDKLKLASGITLEGKQTSSVQPSARVLPTPVQASSGKSITLRSHSQVSMPPQRHNSHPEEDSSVAGPPPILSLDFIGAHHPLATTTAWVQPTMASKEAGSNYSASPISMHEEEEEDEEIDYMASVDPSQHTSSQHQHQHGHSPPVQWLAVAQRQADALERTAAAQERQAAATERAAQAQERMAAAQESAATAHERTLLAVGEVARAVRLTYAQVKNINVRLGKTNRHAIHHTKILEELQADVGAQSKTLKKQCALMRKLSNMAQTAVATSQHHMVATSQSLQKPVKSMEIKKFQRSSEQIHEYIDDANSKKALRSGESQSKIVATVYQIQSQSSGTQALT
ncbi:hypothetical protein NDU88_012373 [Pleurodeles waltl]|uniref:Myb/SANT-like DNA-binding domain-containing protein n=1 Tax=Pleurodeles waltl TaxID=8319 RepID=A0AAV7QZX7_PLEWA|nr:hypothetical protein NDU88_012373 [Pleurodeles waltl]